MVLSGAEMQLGQGESIADTARVLSRYVDLIMIRTFDSDTLYELAKYSTVPIINGLTNESHPCQIMADIMTFEEKRGSIEGKKVVWFGDGNNVLNSFLHAAEKFKFSLTFSGPKELDPSKSLTQEAKNLGVEFFIDRGFCAWHHHYAEHEYDLNRIHQHPRSHSRHQTLSNQNA